MPADEDAQKEGVKAIIDGDEVPVGLAGPPVTPDDMRAAAEPVGEDQ